MDTILYLIRHAQSRPTSERHYSEWPLSSVGKRQAEKLAGMLDHLEITTLFSSPFTRCLQTVEPFASKAGIDIIVENDLRERLVAKTLIDGFYDIWCKSWQDFDFALPGCETSRHAQRRFLDVVTKLSDIKAGKILAISTHGNVIGLFLNSIDNHAGRNEAEELMNPDVIKIVRRSGAFYWDRTFRLPGLHEIATNAEETPVEKGATNTRMQQTPTSCAADN